MKFLHVFIILFPALLFSQTEEKKKFEKENYIHLKAGAVFNETNNVIYKSLNSFGSDIFTPTKNIYYNPLVDVEFESHFSRFVGLSVNLGFMQTRQRFQYTNSGNNSSNSAPIFRDLLILSNIPHVNIAPAFYITNETRVFVGLGLYKYYYHFDPLQIGQLGFDQNAEDLLLYSNIGISQSFDVRRYRCSVSINYFGLTRKFDRGIQVALGIVL